MTSIGLLILLLAAVVSGAIITRDAEKKIKSEKPEVNKPEVPQEKIDPKKENGKDGQVEVNPPTEDESVSNSASQQDNTEVEDNISKENGKAPWPQMLPSFEGPKKDKREPQLVNVFGQHQQAENGGGLDLTNGYIGNGHYINPMLQVNQVKTVPTKAPKSTKPTTVVPESV